MKEIPDHGPFFPRGAIIRSCSNDDDKAEYGVVVHCWLNLELQINECYVAFFGKRIPDKKPESKPYILRYSTASLDFVSGSSES